MEKTCKNCGTPITKEYCEDNYPEACEHWTQKKPQTNADRIRAMSDEELGRFLAEVENRRSVAGGGAIWKDATHAIQWLQQPAKEEA